MKVFYLVVTKYTVGSRYYYYFFEACKAIPKNVKRASVVEPKITKINIQGSHPVQETVQVTANF